MAGGTQVAGEDAWLSGDALAAVLVAAVATASMEGVAEGGGGGPGGQSMWCVQRRIVGGRLQPCGWGRGAWSRYLRAWGGGDRGVPGCHKVFKAQTRQRHSAEGVRGAHAAWLRGHTCGPQVGLWRGVPVVPASHVVTRGNTPAPSGCNEPHSCVTRRKLQTPRKTGQDREHLQPHSCATGCRGPGRGCPLLPCRDFEAKCEFARTPTCDPNQGGSTEAECGRAELDSRHLRHARMSRQPSRRKSFNAASHACQALLGAVMPVRMRRLESREQRRGAQVRVYM